VPPSGSTRDLPADLRLPLASGEPWWYWLGGRPSIDLVNTLRERWNRRVETLVTPDDLRRWLACAGVTAAPVPRVATEVLEEARALREAIDVLVTAAVEGRPAPAPAVAQVDAWLVHAGARPHLSVGPGGVCVLGERASADSPRRALGTLALDAAELLGAPGARARLRICEAEDCSARFFDRSPAGARRWCSMRSCGNAAKARRHRARHREAA
jgi:predicted RNA-binding Zn ribbon-like protein